MKILIYFVLLFLLIISCEKKSTDINNTLDQISLSIEKHSYSELDSINLYLKNESNHDIII